MQGVVRALPREVTVEISFLRVRRGTARLDSQLAAARGQLRWYGTAHIAAIKAGSHAPPRRGAAKREWRRPAGRPAASMARLRESPTCTWMMPSLPEPLPVWRSSLGTRGGHTYQSRFERAILTGNAIPAWKWRPGYLPFGIAAVGSRGAVPDDAQADLRIIRDSSPLVVHGQWTRIVMRISPAHPHGDERNCAPAPASWRYPVGKRGSLDRTAAIVVFVAGLRYLEFKATAMAFGEGVAPKHA